MSWSSTTTPLASYKPAIKPRTPAKPAKVAPTATVGCATPAARDELDAALELPGVAVIITKDVAVPVGVKVIVPVSVTIRGGSDPDRDDNPLRTSDTWLSVFDVAVVVAPAPAAEVAAPAADETTAAAPSEVTDVAAVAAAAAASPVAATLAAAAVCAWESASEVTAWVVVVVVLAVVADGVAEGFTTGW